MTSTEFEQECREANGFYDYEDEPCKCAGCKEELSDDDESYHGEWHLVCAQNAFRCELGITFIETNNLIDEFMAWLPSDYWARTWFDFVDSVNLEAMCLFPPKARTYLRKFCLSDMRMWIEFLEVAVL